MKKKKTDVVIAIVVIAVAIAVVVTLAWKVLGLFRNNGNNTTKESARLEEVDKIINRNLDQRYPETPSAVVKLFCSITKELHSGQVTEEQIDRLFSQLRKLFDDELLANNNYETHYKTLNEEIEKYKKSKMTISRYVVEDADKINIYSDKEGRDCTRILITYSIKNASKWMKSNEEVILRKDNDGHWKIVGYQQKDVAVGDEDEE